MPTTMIYGPGHSLSFPEDVDDVVERVKRARREGTLLEVLATTSGVKQRGYIDPHAVSSFWETDTSSSQLL
jgi:hypothetical protein